MNDHPIDPPSRDPAAASQGPGVSAKTWSVWPLLIGVLIIVVVGGSAFALLKYKPTPQAQDGGRPGRGGGRGGGGGGFGGMPTAVETATAQLGDIPITINALGTVTSLASVTVKTQINGVLTQVAFSEGQLVKVGDFLAQIDERPYQAALEQIKGQLDRDQALLTNAVLDQDRYKKLVAQDSIAKQQLDTQSALVAQYKGTVETDIGQMEMAKLNVAYCHITAPITGRVGLRQVDPGNYIQTGDANGIVVITQLSPISVIFSIPEDSLPSVTKQMQAGKSLRATAMDRSKTTFLAAGSVTSLDNLIDVSTGMIKLRATFDNKRSNLFPNQFVNVRLLVDTLTDAIVIPTSAIQRGAPGIFVYQVKAGVAAPADGSASATASAITPAPGQTPVPGAKPAFPSQSAMIQVIELGPADGETTAVTSGLEVGDIVVTQGADRLKDGAAVEVHAANEAPAGGRRHGHRHGGWGDSKGLSGGSATAASTSPASAASADGEKPEKPADGDSTTPHHHHQAPAATGQQSQ
jgi:multidrug efflux system membrane fusion protein